MTDVQILTEPLGGSALSLATQSGNLPAHWYLPRPLSAGEWAEHVRRVAESFAGGEWLAALAAAFDSSGEAAQRLKRVAAAGGVVVTTGQQPGLFGGPVYTWSKALSALALADELESRTGVPTAAVFWAATDDADFAEARWTKVAVADGVVRLELHDEPPPGTPMSDAQLGDVSAQLRVLERASGSAAFARPLEAARAAYARGATVGGAYVRLLRELLEPLGVAVLDASHPAVRRQGEPVLRKALRGAADVASALRTRAAELRAAGFEPQVADTSELSLVFALNGGVRQRITLSGAPSAASSPPETLAPNVLLRPVVERTILPTVAYAAGPAELAYFAQVSAVADTLGIERPLAVPRWSCSIIEPQIARILSRLRIRHSDLRDPHAVEGRLARAAVPSGVSTALSRIRDAIEQATTALSAEPHAAMMPPAAIAGAKASLLDRLRRLERRYVAAVKRREEDLMRQVATARAHLYPDGDRQERALNFLPMLARSGPPLFDAMRTAAAGHARLLVAPDATLAARGARARRRGSRA